MWDVGDGVTLATSEVSMSAVPMSMSESKIREGDLEEERVVAGSAVGGMVLRVELRPWR